LRFQRELAEWFSSNRNCRQGSHHWEVRDGPADWQWPNERDTATALTHGRSLLALTLSCPDVDVEPPALGLPLPAQDAAVVPPTELAEDPTNSHPSCGS